MTLCPAHAPHSAPELMTWWTWDPFIVAVLSIAGALYARGALRLWRARGAGHGVSRGRAASYLAGLAVLALALLSPLDQVSDVLFSAHMAQHELLMLIAAPLIVIGRPLVPMLWALPRRARVRAARALQKGPVAGAWRLVTAPAIALLLHALVRWIWHLPAAFDAALAHDWIHQIQHITFFASAVLFWWSLLHGRYGRAGYGIAVAFVFFTALHSGLLAALISLSDRPWYAAHELRTHAWGIDAVSDQQRAGLLMWVPAGALMTATGLALLAAWLGESERRIARSQHPGLNRPPQENET